MTSHVFALSYKHDQPRCITTLQDVGEGALMHVASMLYQVLPQRNKLDTITYEFPEA